MERIKKASAAFVVGMVLGAFAALFVVTISGCGTVSGIGRDLMQVSDGVRSAMTQDNE